MSTPLDAPGAGVAGLVRVMDRLRSPGGCPWDAEQTHASLVPFALEEAYEVADAVEDGDRAAMREELGDLLLQVVFHARIAQEHPDEPFDLDDVAREVTAKLVRRHPHVFDRQPVPDGARSPGEEPPGPGRGEAAPDLHAQWDRIKATEKARSSVLDGIPRALGALARGQKVLARARRAGIGLTGAAATGWSAEGQVASPAVGGSAADQVEVEPGSAAERGTPGAADPGAGTVRVGTSEAVAWQHAEIGRRLLEVVATADELGVDAESALRAAIRGVEQQVRDAESVRDAEGTV